MASFTARKWQQKVFLHIALILVTCLDVFSLKASSLRSWSTFDGHWKRLFNDTSSISSPDNRAEASGVAPQDDELPATIWMLWLQGWGQAPPLQKQCLQSWTLYNPRWKVNAISKDDAAFLLGDDFEVYRKLQEVNGDNLQVQAQSDLLRFFILKRHGGVWADSTMLCRRPLDEWLWDTMAADFFAFGPETVSFVDSPLDWSKRLPIVSSFIAAVPNHPIVVSSLNRFVSYWEGEPTVFSGSLGYFWSHVLVGRAIGLKEFSVESDQGDQEAIQKWQLMPKRTGECGMPGPNLFVEKGWLAYAYEKLRDAPASNDTLAIIQCDRETPMLKLSSRQNLVSALAYPDSGLRLLLDTTYNAAIAYNMCIRKKTCSPWRAQAKACPYSHVDASSTSTSRIGGQRMWRIILLLVVFSSTSIALCLWRSRSSQEFEPVKK